MTEDVRFLPKKEILSYEEMYRLVALLCDMGIRKVRITGGEPFLRRDLGLFLEKLADLEHLDSLHITTNGLLTAQYIPLIKKLHINVNLSLDTLDAERFLNITRRNDLDKVLNTLFLLQKNNIPTKINAVIMDGVNTQDIIPLTKLAQNNATTVRFIEEMPFNGTGKRHKTLHWDFRKIIQTFTSYYPDIQSLPSKPTSTTLLFQVPSYQGQIGVIPAFSRTFCGACNRIRITAQGTLKNCLYDNGVLDVKKLLRDDITDENLVSILQKAFQHRSKSGFEAEKKLLHHESMSRIGG